MLHVGYNRDGDDTLYEMQNQNRNDPNSFRLHLNSNRYNYTPRPSPSGRFNNYNLENDVDISSIEVKMLPREVNCRRIGMQKSSWDDVWRELHERVNIERKIVEVKKFDNKRMKGEIVDYFYSCYELENRNDI